MRELGKVKRSLKEKKKLQNSRMEGGPGHTCTVLEFCSSQVNLSQDANPPEGKKAQYTEASSGIEDKGLL